jgi:hypothetical protein
MSSGRTVLLSHLNRSLESAADIPSSQSACHLPADWDKMARWLQPSKWSSFAGTAQSGRAKGWWSSGSIRHYDAVLVSPDNNLDPIAQVELHEDATDMGLDGALLDDQVGGDFSIGQSLSDQS